MNWIRITGYATLLFSFIYILLCFYQMFQLRKLSEKVRIRGLEYYQFLVPFRPKSTILEKYADGNLENMKALRKVLELRQWNGLLFFLSFTSWLAFVAFIRFI